MDEAWLRASSERRNERDRCDCERPSPIGGICFDPTQRHTCGTTQGRESRMIDDSFRRFGLQFCENRAVAGTIHEAEWVGAET
jgi:hypothetical protein